MKRVILIEDNQTLIQSLIFSIESGEKYQVVSNYLDAETAIASIKKNDADFILMDIKLNGKINGIDCTAQLKQKFPELDIIILTVFEESDMVFDALKAGACGYLTKNTSMNEIHAALDQASEGGAPMSFKIARMVLNSFQKNIDSTLTKQEFALLTQLAKGNSYKISAEELGISINTIKFHIKNIYLKMHVNSREEALQLARKRNWL